MDEITLIRITDIVPHPLQERVYGADEPDDDLVASVAAHGVLQPVIVAANARANADNSDVELSDDPGAYMMVSGHRRWRASDRAGLATIPAIIKTYSTTVDLEIEFLASNIQREKSDTQKNAEFSRWKNAAVFIGKLKKNMTLGAFNMTTNCKLNETEFETLKDRHVELLKQFGFDVSDEFRATKFIESVTGIGEHEQRLRTVVTDDNYRDGVYVRLRHEGAGETAIGKLDADWSGVRSRYESGEIKLAAAEKQIKKLISEFEKGLKPKQPKQRVKKVEPKPRAYIAAAVSGTNDYRERFEEAAARFAHDYDIVNPVELIDNSPDVQDGDWSGCMELLLPEMAKCDALVLLPGWRESRGARIERVVAEILGMSIYEETETSIEERA